MKKTFKNVSPESGEITVQLDQAKLSFHVESGAEFTLESSEGKYPNLEQQEERE
ncbi:hypothetical protein [Vibrio fortis]|uniref:hypothetical protein n=1 Tax=Vibrio fortis TaxID=212667 RepID=UPI001783A4AD|nr:hypothetical protein [Vibrio fortis]